MTRNEIAQAIAHDFQTEERIRMIASIRDKSRTAEAKWATQARKSERRAKSFVRTVKGA